MEVHEIAPDPVASAVAAAVRESAHLHGQRCERLARQLLKAAGMWIHAVRLALTLSLTTAACHRGAAPSAEAPDTAADALARRDGPLALDASGRWLPVLDVAARFEGRSLRVLATDV